MEKGACPTFGTAPPAAGCYNIIPPSLKTNRKALWVFKQYYCCPLKLFILCSAWFCALQFILKSEVRLLLYNVFANLLNAQNHVA
jgi:hypothetical protein